MTEEKLTDICITIVDTQEHQNQFLKYHPLLDSELMVLRPMIVIEAGRRWKECVAPGSEFPQWNFAAVSATPSEPSERPMTRAEYALQMLKLIGDWLV